MHFIKEGKKTYDTAPNIPRHGSPAEPTGPVGRALNNKATKRAVVTLEDLSP